MSDTSLSHRVCPLVTCGKRVFEDAEVGASVKLVGAVTVAAATLDAVEACLVFLRDLYC